MFSRDSMVSCVVGRVGSWLQAPGPSYVIHARGCPPLHAAAPTVLGVADLHPTTRQLTSMPSSIGAIARAIPPVMSYTYKRTFSPPSAAMTPA